MCAAAALDSAQEKFDVDDEFSGLGNVRIERNPYLATVLRRIRTYHASLGDWKMC